MKKSGKNQSGRVHLLRLAARNIKTLREIEIDEFGEVLEIRGDTGQGKTSILEAIEGGLTGLDPSMVRKGTDAAEIILELDNARIQRIVRADGRKDVLTVTDPASGKPIDRAKEFLKALCPEGTIFRPLEFVLLGGGDTRGRTERLRQQRNMLLDAMPVSLEPTDVADAIRALGDEAFQEASGVSLDGIDWEQHGLAVCSALEKVFYEARKSVNGAADEAENALRFVSPPAKPAPKKALDQCRKDEEAAQAAFYRAQAEDKARAGTLARRRQLLDSIANDERDLYDRQDLERLRDTQTTEVGRLETQISELRERIKYLEKEAQATRESLAEIDRQLVRHDRITANKAELAQIDATMGKQAEVDLAALEKSWKDAREATIARELQDKHDAASKKAAKARERAKAFDALVALFRDQMPKRIVETMKMPVEGLGIDDGVVCFKGIPLHQLGTSEQLRIAVLLAAAINPQTGFVLIDRAESLGSKDRLALAEAARELNLQLVLTYVDPEAQPAPGRLVMREGEQVK
jgi:hypothetical protein